MSENAATPRQKGSWVWGFLAIVALIALLGAVASRMAIDLGFYTPGWMQAALTPQTAITTQPVSTSVPRVPVQQAAPTSPPPAPTPLPVGQPAAPAPAIPDAPLPAMAAPAVGPNPGAPATIKTRAPVCFGGWWYVEGQNTGISCSGTGGD